MTGPGTNTYLLGETDIAVLDPGPDDAGHLAAILDAAGGRIRTIIVTHTHPDHSPLAAPLARSTGAPVIGLPPPNDGRQDESCRPTHRVRNDEPIQLGDCELLAIHTPGHASNCVSYLLPSERLLFTGDHVLEGVTPVILPPDGDMAAYMHSIAKLLPYEFERIAPGHGEIIEDGKGALETLRRHRLAREAKVLRSLQALGAVSIDELTPVVYADVSPERHPWAALTLRAHLLKLQAEGRIENHDSTWRLPADAAHH